MNFGVSVKVGACGGTETDAFMKFLRNNFEVKEGFYLRIDGLLNCGGRVGVQGGICRCVS